MAICKVTTRVLVSGGLWMFATVAAGQAPVTAPAPAAQAAPATTVPPSAPPPAGQAAQATAPPPSAEGSSDASGPTPPPGAQSGTGEATLAAVTVTGTRITRNGYSAPTPVTVVPTEDLLKTAPQGIPQGLETLPQFSASSGTQNTGNQATTPQGGNYLNLRGLGSIENLVLLNGQRLPPTSYNGTVDTNIIPQAFIQRVDVVTGGASADYGSNAVSGVVNFILDTNFNGFSGNIQGGMSRYSDDIDKKVDLAFGTPIGENSHFEASFDHFDQPGIGCNCDRPNGSSNWVETGTGTAANPYTPHSGVVYGNGAPGTLISGAPGFSYNGYQFAPNGSAIPFNPGTPTGTPGYSIGGSGVPSLGHTLTGSQDTNQFFARFDHSFSSDLKGFVQASFTRSVNDFTTIATGTQINGFNIMADNAFLPANVAAAMASQGIASFTGSRIEYDQPPKVDITTNLATIFLAGLEGEVGDYKWSVDYSFGESQLESQQHGNFYNPNFFAALDAVRGPSGNIVCKVTLTNPGLYPGCIPFNPFGQGAPSAAAYNYILGPSGGVSEYGVRNEQNDISGQFSGDLFAMPAGPFSFAVGAEAREESLKEISNANPSQPISLTGLETNYSVFNNLFNSTNVGSAQGSEHVEEAFAEIAVPIVKDVFLAKSLDFNAAVRYTDYSTSGSAETWKFGATWKPVDELRFRATVSRDIRAPTLYELYGGLSASRGNFTDVHTGQNNILITESEGNPDLKPEIGHTTTAGVIWQPDYVPGFSASVDYFQIRIDNQITTIDATTIDQECEGSGGTGPTCAFIARPLPYSNTTAANFPLTINSVPFNEAEAYMHGTDFEMNYRMPLSRFLPSSDARIDWRLLGTWTPVYETQATATSAPIQVAGTLSYPSALAPVPKMKANAIASFTDHAFGFVLQARYIGHMDQSDTPTVVYTNNAVPAVTYWDATASYDFEVAGGKLQWMLSVQNIFNKEAPLIPNGQPGQQYPTNQGLYDVIGTYFTTGVKFKF
jgi:iron complex outermembrane recepter protein